MVEEEGNRLPIDFFLGGESPNTEADRRMGHVLLDTDRSQHIRRLQRRWAPHKSINQSIDRSNNDLESY